MRIRSKLAALIAVPLLILGTIALVGFRNQSATIEAAEDARDAIAINQAIDRSVLAIGLERLLVEGADVGTFEDVQGDTNAQLAALADLVESDETAAEQAATALAAVAAARTGGGREELNEGVDALLAIDIDTAADYPSADAFAVAQVNHLAVETIDVRERAWLNYLDSNGALIASGVPLATTFADADGRFDTLVALMAAADTDPLDDAISSDEARTLRELEVVAVDDLAESNVSVQSGDAFNAIIAFRDVWTNAVEWEGIEVTQLVADQLSDAESSRSLSFLMVILGLFVLAALLFVVQRQVTTPLEHLTSSADEIANQKLPSLIEIMRSNTSDVASLPDAEPIPVETTDEIGELVMAFNNVQVTAFDLAREQAVGRRNVQDMFVNLGRRNQQLLQRILGQLTRLEQEEEDPDTLRELFELDNAVTRMRRNAESLVALAGAQTPRQWSQSIGIENAVRGAFGEVEGYERIEITSLGDAKVQGSVVADVTHLMAELLENALNFSDSTSPVFVSGQREGDEYHISIVDQGIGMTANELTEYNQRITDPPPLERVPTKFLGLYVVGRLAERHDIRVRLGEAPNRGVLARIELTRELLDLDDELPPLRQSSDEGDQSPLEEDHDLDAELQEMIAEDQTAGEDDPGDDDGADHDAPAPSATAAPADDGALPTRGGAVATAEAATETLPARGAAKTGAAPVPADDDALPTRGTAKANATPTPEADTDALPTRGTAKAKATPTPEADTDALPTRGTAKTEPEGEDLPTRGRIKAVAEATDSSGAEQRGGLDQRAATDNSEKSAGDFSSMMSALSTGISRGITETTSSDSGRENDSDTDQESSD
ncbi:MAG: ATP-binding protein [Actinomycetota bacterium]